MLSSETGAITLRVSASHHARGKTLREVKKTARADFSTVASEEGRQVYSVLRGTGKDGNRLIKRIALRDGDLFKLELSYPEERALSAPLVDRILASFDATPTDELTGVLVQVAVLDYTAGKEAFEKESDGKKRGCDRVVFVDRNVARTEQPLSAALEELFAIEQFDVGGWQNFIAKTNETLSFDRATIDDGVASLYLRGKLSGLTGTCDDPRARIQIEETALQFPEVDSVAIYLNGQPTDLQPDARG